MPVRLPISGLRVKLEDAQLLVAAAGLRDSRGPRDRLFARGQFEYGEAAVERRRPWVAAQWRAKAYLARPRHSRMMGKKRWVGEADPAYCPTTT